MSATDPAPNLTDDVAVRGAITALRLWVAEGQHKTDWRDYRDSAVAWLDFAKQRLEQL